MNKIELELAVAAAKANLSAAEKDLSDFIALPINNVFDSLESASDELEERLSDQAFEDCQGAGNRGQEEYEQEFIVDGVHYLGKLSVEYNRHDKTYYYIEESDFTYEPIDRDGE